jgi:hypothetical protein
MARLNDATPRVGRQRRDNQGCQKSLDCYTILSIRHLKGGLLLGISS